MINNKKDLKLYLDYERKLYLPKESWRRLILWITKERIYYLWKYVYYLRKSEYFYNSSGFLKKVGVAYYRRKRNALGLLLNIQISENCFGKGLQLFQGNVVVNSNAVIGENCKLHGMNCIGRNKGEGILCPTLGDNVEMGVGSIIIGGVVIPSHSLIGANSLVVSTPESGG